MSGYEGHASAQADVLEVEPGHSVRLPGGQWTVWRTAALRGAGFPAPLVRALSSGRAADAADRYLEPHAAPESRAAAQTALVRACELDTALLYERLRQILSDERFREAVIWQNRRALDVAMRRLCDGLGKASDRRKAAEFVALLVQRYAVKNDSIGFFGPVGWATLVSDPIEVACAPSTALISRREVYFEGWAIDALADALRDPGLLPWMAPQLNAGVWLDTDAVYAPGIGRVAVSPADDRVLRLCDGSRAAVEIVAMLRAADPGEAVSEESVFAALRRLVALGLIRWQLEVAPQLYPERQLRARLERIGVPALRDACLGALGQLVAARDRVATAAGRTAELNLAMDALETTFTRLTGQPPTRRPGRIYAARGLVYEDCWRGCEVILGRTCLARLGPPLSIVLNAARWVSVGWRQEFTEHMRHCHAELRSRGGDQPIDAQVFVDHVIERAGGAAARVQRGGLLATASERLRRRFQDRWRAILSIPDGAAQASYTVAEVTAGAAEAFDTCGCGSWAGYFSPDVLVSAPGIDAFRRGDCHFVLGEVHSGNTLLWSAFAAQLPDPHFLPTALASDAGHRPVFVMQYPKQFFTSRLDLVLAPSFWRYEQGDDLPSLPGCRSLPAARLIAVDEGSTVQLRARDGGLAFDAYDLFSQFLHHEISALIADWLPDVRHSPRVIIGDLTIAREQWRFAAEELSFAREPERHLRFARMRAWARQCGMPRHVFVKCPDEPKPCYLDFDSLVYGDIFARMIRRSGGSKQIRIVEMLPGIDGTWLIDTDGARYTSELRLVARIDDRS